MTTKCGEPHLGLATTREIIEELKARGDFEARVYHSEQGDKLADAMRMLLKTLPGSMLDYRTVDPKEK